MSRYELMQDVAVKVFDENALSVAQIAAEAGVSYQTAQRLAKNHAGRGTWERVWKHSGGRPIPAYRRVEKKTGLTKLCKQPSSRTA